MARRRGTRTAPQQFARSPAEVDPTARALWRGLRLAFVPFPGSAGTGSGMIEWLGSVRATNNNLTPTGEALGLAANTSPGNGLGFGSTGVVNRIPQVAPLSAFAFLVRRDSSNTIQSLIGTGALTMSGWTFQLNYGGGQIGLTRWGIGDHVSSMGAVPNTGGQASAVGVTTDGATVRLFQNGTFESIASGAINTATGGQPSLGRNGNGLTPLLNTSLYVVYVWDRVLSDGEMLALWRDPWTVLRPRRAAAFAGGGAAIVTPGLGALTLTGYEPAIGPNDLRVTQVGIKVLVSEAVSTAALRTTQTGVKALVVDTPDLRVTQAGVKALVADDPDLRVTQAGVKALVVDTPDLRVTQVGVKVLVAPSALSVPLTGLLFPRGSVPPF